MALGIFKDFVNSAVAACKTIVNVVHDASSMLTKVVRVKSQNQKKGETVYSEGLTIDLGKLTGK